MAIFSKFHFLHGKSIDSLENAWNHLKICRNDLWGILNNFLIQIFDILIFRNFMASAAEPEGKKRKKTPFFHFQRCEKSRKIKISKICIRNFLKPFWGWFIPNFRWFEAFSRKFKEKNCNFFIWKIPLQNIRDFRQQQKPWLTFSFITFEPSVSRSSMSTFWKLERQLYNI